MTSRLCFFVVPVLFAANAVTAQTSAPAPVQETNKSTVGFYGFARLDVIASRGELRW